MAQPDLLPRQKTAAVDTTHTVEAGLDALDTPQPRRIPLGRRVLSVGVPPLVALVVVIGVWQLLWAAAIWPEYKLPSPAAVWDQFAAIVADGSIWEITWTSR